jgi:hypothetical protein
MLKLLYKFYRRLGERGLIHPLPKRPSLSIHLKWQKYSEKFQCAYRVRRRHHISWFGHTIMIERGSEFQEL